MSNWIRKLFFAPIDPSYISPENRAIEILERQLVLANEEKKLLLDTIIKLQEPTKEVIQPTVTNFKPINTYTPWRVRQQMLEKEDAEKFKLQQVADKEQKEIERLEKELELATESESNQESIG